MIALGVYAQYLALIRLTNDPESLRAIRKQAWDKANSDGNALSGAQLALILQIASQKIEALEQDAKPKDICPQCGLPWDDHPYDQGMDDLICRKLIR
jgi:hypothetical protein